MAIRSILDPFISHKAVCDLGALKKQATDGDWSQMLRLKWVVVVDVIPGLAAKSVGYLTDLFFHIVTFNLSLIFADIRLALNAGMQAVGFTVTLLPSGVGKMGYGLVESFRKSEFTFLISRDIQYIASRVRSSYHDGPEKEKAYDALQKLRDEMNTLGYLTFASLDELATACEPFRYSGSIRETLHSLRYLAVKLSPDVESKGTDVQAIEQKEKTLLSDKKSGAAAAVDLPPDLTSLFSVVHGGFTGDVFYPANAEQLAGYLLELIKRIRSNERKEMHAALSDHSDRIDLLEKRLKIIREFEGLKKTYGNDHKKFAQKVLEKLATEKTISIPSGILMGPVAQRAYITFKLEERDGKQWISGQVINLGQGAEGAIFDDEFGRLRIHPELVLRPAPLEEVQKSFFWRTFLNLGHSTQADGNPTQLTMDDFTEKLLGEWPTKTGGYQKRGKKLQIAPNSEFTALKEIIQDVLGPKCSEVFMLGFCDAVLEDYVGEKEITEENLYALKETSSHLARKARRSFAEMEELSTAIQKRLAVLDRGIQTFEEGRKVLYEQGRIPCEVPFQEILPMPVRVLTHQPPVTRKVVLNPPDGNLQAKLSYYLNEGGHHRYSDRDRLCILRRGVETIPSVSDPIWETDEGIRLIETAKDLKNSWFRQLSGDRYHGRLLHMGSDDAALMLKVITVEFKVYSQMVGAKGVRDFFLSRMKTVLESDGLFLLRPTHPDRMQEFRESVDYILKESSELKAADNIALMDVKVSSLDGLKRYPHLYYLYEHLQAHPTLKQELKDQIEQARLQRIPPDHKPATDLDCVRELYSGWRLLSHPEEPVEWKKLFHCWGEFFGYFGVRASSQSYHKFSHYAYDYSGTHEFVEDFSGVYNSKNGYSDRFPGTEDKEACQTNLFLETYPNIEGREAEKLLPILKRELRYDNIDKIHENQHLLLNEGIEIEEEGIPFYELQSLLGITTYKDLTIDLAVKHFDRFFPRMRKQIFCTFFQAFLTQVFIEEGNTHSLLERASKSYPEQVFQLLDFLQKRRISSKRYNWDQTTSFLFWMEGVALSYLIRYQKDDPQVETAYQNFLMQTRYLIAGENEPELQLDLSGRLVSLGPYFENTAKKDSFRDLINRVVGGVSDVPDRSREETRRLDHGFVTHVGDIERTTLENRTRVINTESFQGVYRRVPYAQLGGLCVRARCYPFSTNFESDGLEVYRQDGRDLVFKQGEILPSYCIENGRIELLEKGNRTGLYLATSSYDAPMGQFLDRIAPPKDLYIWKNSQNKVIRVDYKKLGLTLNYESDPENPTLGHWMSSTHPGYHLDPSFRSSEFEPSSHYLVLRNSKGQRVVYVLEAPFTASGQRENLTENALFAITKESAKSLLVYHLDEEKEIDFSKMGHEELLYGMYLTLQERNYDKAALWLKEWEKQTPLHTERTIGILNYFISMIGEGGFDTNPRSLAIRLKLELSVLNDPLYKLSEEEEKKLKEALLQDGVKYRHEQNNVFPFKLSEDQFAQLNTLIPSNFVYYLMTQVQMFLTKLGTFANGADLYRIPFDQIPFSKDALKELKGIDNVLRPHDVFIQNFLAYYHLAKTAAPSDPRIEELRYLLRSCSLDKSDTVKAIREILLGVLDNPFAFPKTEELLVLQETFSKEQVITQLYNDAKQINLMSFINEGLSIIYSMTKTFVLQTYETHKAKIVLWTIQMLLVIMILRIPSRFLGPFAELCEERYFGLFFRSLLSALLRPAIEWSSKELERLQKPIMSRIWSSEPKPLPYLKPTMPAEIFTPTLTFNSQLDAPIETCLRLQSSDDPYLIPERCDKSQDLKTLEEMRRKFTAAKEDSREPCVQRERAKFLKGLDEKKAELERINGTVEYKINQNRIGALRAIVRKEKEKFEQIAREKSSLVLRIAHHYPPQLHLEVKGGLLQALSLEELIVAFGRKDHEKILRSNPSLSREELARLEQLIGEYLVAKTAEDRLAVACQKLSQAEMLHTRLTETQARNRIANTFYSWRGQYHDPAKDQREVDALLTDSLQILQTKRCFAIAQNPHLLVFEYFMKLTLRQNQVTFLDRLTGAMGDPKTLERIIEEAHTGFGKSKVAIPLWLYLTSQSGRIAMITVPETLLEEMRIHLKQVLGKVYDQGISPIYFDRTRANDLNYLKYINQVFEDAEATGKCVVISINSLHGIAVLKHKENYFRRAQEGLPAEYIEELDKTRRILAEKVSNFIDEATDALYIRYSYDYSVGRKKPLGVSYIETTRELYDLLVENTELLKRIDFDFMQQAEGGETQKYVDEETYEKVVLPALIESVIKKFAIPTQHQAAARTSLAGGYDAGCETFFSSLNQKESSQFAQIRRELVTYFRQSFSCRWNERYKLGEDRIAYPARNGKLIPRSQFSALDLILNFTMQANIRVPFEMKHIEDFIEGLINDSLSKSQQEFEGSVGFRVYQRFSNMLGGLPQFAELKKGHKQALLEAINSTPQNRLLFTEGYVLPKLEYFPRKIVSYPQLIFNRVHNQGATGTLSENVPSGFKLNFDPKTIFRNLIVLWQKSKDQLFSIPKLEGRELINHLFHNFNGNFNVIIDIAGYIRGFSSSEELARAILEVTAHRASPIDAVGFIDSEGRNLILKRGASAPVLRANASIDVDRIFQVYRQEDVIGFDINLDREAKAIITCGRFTRRDFFMQGAGRLRGLNSGMVASFVTIEEEMEYIREALEIPKEQQMLFEDLFLYVFNLEGEKQGDEAFDVMYHEWLAKIENLFWNKDLDLPMSERTKLFNQLGNFYCQKVFQDPIGSLRLTREELSMDEVTEGTQRELLSTFEKIVAEHPNLAEDYARDKLKPLIEGQFEKNRLREKATQLRGGSELQLSFSEVEQEDDKDLELEMIQVKDLARSSALFFEPEEPQPLERPYDDLGQYPKVQRFHPKSERYVNPDILCCDNFFRISEYMPELYRVTMKPARYSLIVQNRKEKTYQVVLLDLHTANEIYAAMKQDKEDGRVRHDDFDYYLIGNDTMNLLAANGKEKWTQETANETNLRALMLEARPYTGKLDFDHEDQTKLQESEIAIPFFKTIEDRFVKPWPYYQRSLDNYSALVM